MAATKTTTYKRQQDKLNSKHLKLLCDNLPDYIRTFFKGRENTLGEKTKVGYAYDFKNFFEYLKKTNPLLENMEIKDIPLDIIDSLTIFDLEEYVSYLKYHKEKSCIITPEGAEEIREVEYSASNSSIARKTAAIKSLYAYFYKHDMISSNPASLMEIPKIDDKAIIRLDADEIAILLDYMEECGKELNAHQLAYYRKTIRRDLAIFTLLLGTGIRISECVGIDLADLNFKEGYIKVVRKGGNENNVYFGEEVEIALLNYLEYRESITPEKGHENALFLSLQKKRISPDAIRDLVTKYTEGCKFAKKLTPHGFRRSFGTQLYRETGDLYLTAEALGHKNLQVTKSHYASMDSERLKHAARVTKLRETVISKKK